jgi:hypothetical protein
MEIENWELSIGQIFNRRQAAKLFLRSSLAAAFSQLAGPPTLLLVTVFVFA